jgi:hypothetical protein
MNSYKYGNDLPKHFKDELDNIKNMFNKTGTLDHLDDLGILDIGTNYFPLVGDPCYRFNREVKERFFNNVYCAFLFYTSTSHLK